MVDLARIAELEAGMERCEGLKAAHMRSDHETGKYNEELLARIAELEATVDAQDRQIEARSGETAAERMFKEELLKAKARIADAATEQVTEYSHLGYDEASRKEIVAAKLGAEGERDSYKAQYDAATERAEGAEARIAEAAKLHRPFEWSFGFGAVKSCRGCADRGVPQEKAGWPCADAVALGLNEEENE